MAQSDIDDPRCAGFWEGADPATEGWTRDDTEEYVYGKMDELIFKQGV